jgi:hypothetical protein
MDYFCIVLRQSPTLAGEVQKGIASNSTAFAVEISKMYPMYFTPHYMHQFHSWCQGPAAAHNIMWKMQGFIKTEEVVVALQNVGQSELAEKLRRFYSINP